jgi:tetratricopeptide (TPR) repeat protein
MAEAADFFVSYTSADRAWAEWIAWQLEDEGYRVLVQAWDFAPGRDWVHEMQQATATAERVVAVLSAAYLRSAHGEAEWRVFYAQDPSAERGLLLPIRVDKVDPPGLFKTRIYVDLVDQDAAGARAALLAAARGARGKPSQEPEFPGDRRSAGSATEAPQFPGAPTAQPLTTHVSYRSDDTPEPRSVWNILPRNRNFVDRTGAITTVRRWLDRGSSSVAITGMGGIGKTQLAIEYAWRHVADYEVAWWISAEQELLIAEQLAQLAGRLGIPSTGRSTDDAARALGLLRQQRRWLLVYDNATSPAKLRHWLPSGLCHTLITSRTPDWGAIAPRVELDVLTPGVATTFLRRRVEHLDPKFAREIADELGLLPLALEQTAAYLESTSISPAYFLERYRRRRESFVNRGEDLFYGGTIDTAWSLALDQLRSSAPGTAQLLVLIAFCGPEPVPLSLFSHHPDKLSAPIAASLGDEPTSDLDFDHDVVGPALGFSLIRRHGDTVIMHRLVQTVVRARLTTMEHEQAARIVRSLLIAHQPSTAADDPSSWPRWKVLAPHVLASPALETPPGVALHEADTRQLLLNTCRYLRSRGDAVACREAVLRLHEAWAPGIGAEHPDTLSAGDLLAAALYDIGDHMAARARDEQVLAARRRVLGADHPDTLASARNLARDSRGLSDYATARALSLDTLERSRRVLGENHPDTLTSANSLARALAGLGKYQAARELDERTLERRRQVLGEDHPDTLTTACNLVGDLCRLGDFEAATRIGQRTFEISRTTLGADHPDTLNAASNLAVALAGAGNLQSARALDEDTLARCAKVLGEEHPNTLYVKVNLASDLSYLGEYDMAVALGVEAVEQYRRTIGRERADSLAAANNLAIDLRHLGRDDQAAQVEEELRQYRGEQWDAKSRKRERRWWWTRGR